MEAPKNQNGLIQLKRACLTPSLYSRALKTTFKYIQNSSLNFAKSATLLRNEPTGFMTKAC